MVVFILVMVFGLCFSLFNYLFLRDKYKRMTDEEIKSKSFLNSPTAWLLYTIIFFLGIVAIITYYILKLMQEIMKLS